MSPVRRRVVITGIGPVTPVGIGVEPFWRSLSEGRSGAGKLDAFDCSDYASRVAAQVHDFKAEDYLERGDVRRMDRFAHFAVAAGKLALSDASLDLAGVDVSRVGAVIGTGIGGIGAFEAQVKVLAERGPSRISPHLVALMIPNMAAGQVAMRLGITGPNDCTVTACAASGHAIARAVDLIRESRADVCLAGGTEAAITPLTVAGFCAARALSTRNDDPEAASRPFDTGRDGFVIGEGSTVLVLESAEHAAERSARVYAEIAGYGMSADAFHETAPEPDGVGGAAAMRAALADAEIEPSAISYINAHGTSTSLGDIAEARAINAVFAEHTRSVAVSSTKSMTGHLLGAAGATEVAASVLAMTHGVLPPTINLDDPDPACPLDHVAGSARPVDVTASLSNSFGFGGHNVSIVMVKP
jgi:3-oxoacyl-[acyl-carrier-protein] synthase II